MAPYHTFFVKSLMGLKMVPYYSHFVEKSVKFCQKVNSSKGCHNFKKTDKFGTFSQIWVPPPPPPLFGTPLSKK